LAWEEQRALRAGRRTAPTEYDAAPFYERYHGLREHRTADVRRHARHNLLAYGFLRGVAYRTMEATAKTQPDWKAVEQHARTFCPDRLAGHPWPEEWATRWKAWRDEAKGLRLAG
jgi:hypothetical protein